MVQNGSNTTWMLKIGGIFCYLILNTVYSADISLYLRHNAIASITCLGHYINIDIHNKKFNEKVSKMIFFNINLVLQSELSPEKEKGHPDPHV